MAGIADIAREAEVSKSTVSLVLNDKIGPSLQTRQRVLEAVHRLKYIPARQRRNRADSLNVAIVLPHLSDRRSARTGLYGQWIQVCRLAIVEADAHFSIFSTAATIRDDGLFREMIEAGQVSGVLLFGSSADDGYAEYILQQDLPLVVMSRRPSRYEFCYVAADDRRCGREAAEHLLGLGHQRLASVTVSNHGLAPDHAALRRDGFAQTVRNHSAEALVEESFETIGTDFASEARTIANRLLEAGVTGVLATNDSTAVYLINALEELGAAVPERVSVVGVDDQDKRSRSGLRPTSFALDITRMGRVAVEILLSQLTETTEVGIVSMVVPGRLIPHDTTAAVAEHAGQFKSVTTNEAP